MSSSKRRIKSRIQGKEGFAFRAYIPALNDGVLRANRIKTIKEALLAAIEAKVNFSVIVHSAPDGWQEMARRVIDSNDENHMLEFANDIFSATIRITADATTNSWLFDLRQSIIQAKFPPKKMVQETGLSTKWQMIIFISIWGAIGVGLNYESNTQEGKMRTEEAYNQAAKSIAENVECDDLTYPDLCASIREEAEQKAKKALDKSR